VLDVERTEDIGQFKENSGGLRDGVQHGQQQVPAASSDVGDRLEPAEVVPVEDRGDVRTGLRGYRPAEDVGLRGAILQVAPDSLRPQDLDAGRPVRTDRTSSVRLSQVRGIPISWANGRIDFGWSVRRSVDAGLCRYPSAVRSNTPCATSRRRTRFSASGATSQAVARLATGHRGAVEVVGDPQLGDGVQASRYDTRGRQVPQYFVGERRIVR
jgi:hypothetical protein